MNKKHVNKEALTELAKEASSPSKCPSCGCNCGGYKK